MDLPGDLYADELTEIYSISNSHFPEMIHHCPLFTEHTVHIMIDRTRIYNTRIMQDEKLISIGRLAAGLAHELNNPASVAIRNTKILRENQANAEDTSRLLHRAGLSDHQFEKIENLFMKCLALIEKTTLLPIEKSDLQDKINEWLEEYQIDTIDADQLVDLAVSPEDLDNLQSILSPDIFETALKWIVASCNIHKLTGEIEKSTNQIYQLVEAVKKYTYMDNLTEKELVNVESGINESLWLLDSKTKSKNAEITIEIDKELPRVHAHGAELNQVWFSLLDNALDAIPESGKIKIWAGIETDLLVVRIIDNGPGIPSEQINRIFDPFYTTKPPGQGTGLGLPLSRRFVQSYNGEIYLHSEVGRTEFCVNLNPSRSEGC